MDDTQESLLLSLTADIVSAHVVNNSVAVTELPALIANVHSALKQIGSPADPVSEETLKPAVSIRSSIRPNYLVCLEDGKKLTMLKRHLRTAYDMTPQEYRAKWNLPRDYPMVAPAYAEKRCTLAHNIGLGRKPSAPPEMSAVEEAAPAPRRKPRTKPAEATPVVPATKPKATRRPLRQASLRKRSPPIRLADRAEDLTNPGAIDLGSPSRSIFVL